MESENGGCRQIPRGDTIAAHAFSIAMSPRWMSPRKGNRGPLAFWWIKLRSTSFQLVKLVPVRSRSKQSLVARVPSFVE